MIGSASGLVCFLEPTQAFENRLRQRPAVPRNLSAVLSASASPIGPLNLAGNGRQISLAYFTGYQVDAMKRALAVPPRRRHSPR